MAWFILIIAGLFETFAVAMIHQLSIKRNWQTVLFIIIGLGGALCLLSYSLETIPMGTGYAVWTGISVIASAIIGMFYFGESKDWRRIFFLSIILSSIVGLKLLT